MAATSGAVRCAPGRTLNCANSCTTPGSNDTPADLVEFDGFEQCLEIALAETLVALALDDFEEDGPDDIGRENLQQHAFAGGAVAVDEDAPLAQLFDLLVVSRHPRVDTLVIGLRRVLESDATAPQHIDGAIDVVGGQRDVLDALAAVFAQVFLDLRLVVLRFVDGNTDLAAGTGERTRNEAGLLAFDVEVADFAEIEQPFVELAPLVHVAAVHVVREVIDLPEPGLLQRLYLDGLEIDVVDRPVAVAVHEVDQRAADADDGGNVELHRPDLRTVRLRAELYGTLEGRGRIPHAETHGAHRRAMRLRESLAERTGLCIDDEIDV